MSIMASASGADLQARFARAVEAEYAVRVAKYRAAGADGQSAHQFALEEVTELGREALAELRARNLFPWPSAARARREGGNA
jgi:hypothetical protein